MPDVISFNIYTGWYQDCSIQMRFDDELQWIEKTVGNKPVIISELGAAAMYGYRDRACCKWSEEYQSELIKESLGIYMTDERVTGVFI